LLAHSLRPLLRPPSSFFTIPRPPRSTLFPYTTLFRSKPAHIALDGVDIFLLLFRRIGVVEAQMAAATELQSDERGAGIYRRHQRSEEHTSELQSLTNLVCRLLLEKKNIRTTTRDRRHT